MSLRVSRCTLMRTDGSTCTLWLARATCCIERFRGLIARPLPDPGQGLWLEPCNAVHSLGMRAPIDLVFVDRARRVLAVEAGLAPWRAAACRRAHSTIELRAGEACRLRIEPGAVLLEAGAPLPVDDPLRVGHHPLPKEPAMSQHAETRTTPRPRGGRTRAAAAAAAVTLVSGCATPELVVEAPVGDEGRAAQPVVSAIAERSADSQALPAGGPSAPDSGTARSAPAAPDDASPARLAEAETLYRASRLDEALAAFRTIVGADPGHAHAWLRIGNVLHRKREWFDALSAYRKAARPQADPAIREKAVYNVALLNLELARQALKRLERIRGEQGGLDGRAPSPRGAGVSEAAARHLSDQVTVSYRALAAARQPGEPGPRRHPGRDDPGARTGSVAETAAAPEPGPRTPASPPASLPAERPVEVEIRQGGGGR